MNNRPLLIALLVIVAAARFVIAPIVTWQGEQRDALERLRHQHAKAEQLIEQREAYAAAAQQLAAANQAELATVFAKADNLRLLMQQQLEASLKQHSLTLSRFDWVVQTPGELERQVAAMAIEGKLEDLQAWHLEISQQSPWWYVNEWRIRRANTRADDFSRFQGDITLAAFAAVQEASNAP